MTSIGSLEINPMIILVYRSPRVCQCRGDCIIRLPATQLITAIHWLVDEGGVTPAVLLWVKTAGV